MPGIYLHIPFCKQACHYCNFHFSTSLQQKSAMVTAILRELDLQKDYLAGQALTSVYFGGGTPSLLDTDELVRIFEKITILHHLRADAEITLEANPDDLSLEKLRELRAYTPINRLSIGIQSFAEADLRWMNRAHNATHAHTCVEQALATGFDNLSLDLIYGAPTTPDEQWQSNVNTAMDFGVPHLSCYCLTIEDGTALGHFVKKGKEQPVEEEKSARQFEWLMARAGEQGYDHYEISNFAKPGQYARHNANYWLGEHYLGVGPAAHSFNGQSRQWNVANNTQYITALAADTLPFEREKLTATNRYNEYVMTSLRTIWGCDLAKIRAMGADFESNFLRLAQPYLQHENMTRVGDTFFLTTKSKFLADGIAADLFFPA